jgi:hypothetical protein
LAGTKGTEMRQQKVLESACSYLTNETRAIKLVEVVENPRRKRQ